MQGSSARGQPQRWPPTHVRPASAGCFSRPSSRDVRNPSRQHNIQLDFNFQPVASRSYLLQSVKPAVPSVYLDSPYHPGYDFPTDNYNQPGSRGMDYQKPDGAPRKLWGNSTWKDGPTQYYTASGCNIQCSNPQPAMYHMRIASDREAPRRTISMHKAAADTARLQFAPAAPQVKKCTPLPSRPITAPGAHPARPAAPAATPSPPPPRAAPRDRAPQLSDEVTAAAQSAAAIAAHALSAIPHAFKQPRKGKGGSRKGNVLEEITERWTIQQEVDATGAPVTRAHRTYLEEVVSTHDGTSHRTVISASPGRPNEATITKSSIRSTPSRKSIRFLVEISPKMADAQTTTSDGHAHLFAREKATETCSGGGGVAEGYRERRRPASASASASPSGVGGVRQRVKAFEGAVREALRRLGEQAERAPSVSAAAISAAAGDASDLYRNLQRAREQTAVAVHALQTFRSRIHQGSSEVESGSVRVSDAARVLVQDVAVMLTELQKDVMDQALRCHNAQQLMMTAPPPPITNNLPDASLLHIPNINFSSDEVFDPEEMTRFLNSVLETLNDVAKLTPA